MIVNIDELKGIVDFGDYSIALGDERFEVLKKLNEYESAVCEDCLIDYCYDSDIIIYYDNYNKVDRITINLYDALNIDACYFMNKQIHDIYYKDVVNLLCQYDKDVIEENGVAYYFENMHVDLWKALSENEAEAIIAETKEAGQYEEMQEELESDIRKSQYFSSISINSPQYFEKIFNLIE